MHQAVTTTRIALNHAGNFKKRMVYERELRSYVYALRVFFDNPQLE